MKPKKQHSIGQTKRNSQKKDTNEIILTNYSDQLPHKENQKFIVCGYKVINNGIFYYFSLDGNLINSSI